MSSNLLIGGSGFIGAALGQGLLDHNEQVISLSRSGQGDAPGVKSIKVNLYEESCPQELINQADAVFVLLGQTHQGFNREQERQLINGLVRDLQKGDSRIFYFSSVMVYGQTPAKAKETTPCHPLDDYAKFKLESEAMFKKSIAPERLTILRLANIYGSPKNKGFINLLMRKLMEPTPEIRLNGNGQQHRDFVFIDDLIRATIAIANKPESDGLVNVSTGISHSLTEVVDLASVATGKKINYEITGMPLNEPQDSLIDNTRLKNVYGYEDFIPLKEGLERTFRRYQEAVS